MKPLRATNPRKAPPAEFFSRHIAASERGPAANCFHFVIVLRSQLTPPAKRAIFTASSHAQRAADYLNGLPKEGTTETATAR